MKNDLRDRANAACINAIAWCVAVGLAVAGAWTGDARHVAWSLLVYLICVLPFDRERR